MTGHSPDDDDRHLAALGYKQELIRNLGSFSTFATGFAFISILTGMFLLFGFVYSSGGPASIWAWVVAVIGQVLFALSFAELSVKYPLAGSVYSWTKHITRGSSASWLAGISMILALIVSSATVALTMQTILPAISPVFWLYGDGSGPHDATINGVILGSIMLVLTTIVSLLGSKARALVNNIGVSVELIASIVLIIGLAINAKHGPSVVFETNGTGLNYTGGYLGALLLCLLLGLTVMWGFDTAGSLGEETINPRHTSPRAIIRALVASGVFGALLILAAVMAIPKLDDQRVADEGLSYVVKASLGTGLGNVMLVCAAIAVFVCGLANQTGAVNMMFAMARDNALPGSSRLAKVAERAKTPMLPPLIVLVVGVAILIYNIGQPAIFLTVSSTTVVFALISYFLITGSFSLARLRGDWEQPDKQYFGLGKWGLVVSVVATIWAASMIVNIAWPRQVLYNPDEPFHWYLQWGGVLIPAVALALAFLVYWFTQRKKIGILPEHSSGFAAGQSAPRATELETR